MQCARVTPERQVPWGLLWTLSLPSLSHLAALSLYCGTNDPELPDLLWSSEVLGLSLAGWEGLGEGHAQGRYPEFFTCCFAHLLPVWSVRGCVSHFL